MKKKHIFLALIISLFAAGSIINMHLAENERNTDISLADISVMAQADGENNSECTRTCFDESCNPVWDPVNCEVTCGTTDCNFSYAQKL